MRRCTTVMLGMFLTALISTPVSAQSAGSPTVPGFGIPPVNAGAPPPTPKPDPNTQPPSPSQAVNQEVGQKQREEPRVTPVTPTPAH
jgi:hypothetical protein